MAIGTPCEFVATYDVVTPMVLRGANQAAEFRLASFVNVVRWWWRFLALGRFDGSPESASFWEAVLLGWSAAPFGRKRVSFHLARPPVPGYPEPWSSTESSGWNRGWSGVNYLAGQGLQDRQAVDVKAFCVEAVLSAFEPPSLPT